MKAAGFAVAAFIACSPLARADGPFRLAKCGLEVAMPATVVCQDVINEDRIGRIVHHSCSASVQPPLTVYSVGCDDYPAANVNRVKGDALLRRILQEEVAVVRGKLVSVTEVQNGTLPGKEAVIDFLGHRKVERIFLVGHRLFHVGVVAPASNFPDVARFLASFHLAAPAK